METGQVLLPGAWQDTVPPQIPFLPDLQEGVPEAHGKMRRVPKGSRPPWGSQDDREAGLRSSEYMSRSLSEGCWIGRELSVWCASVSFSVNGGLVGILGTLPPASVSTLSRSKERSLNMCRNSHWRAQ